MQTFKSSTATVIELRFFMNKKMKMKKNLWKSYLPVFCTSYKYKMDLQFRKGI